MDTRVVARLVMGLALAVCAGWLAVCTQEAVAEPEPGHAPPKAEAHPEREHDSEGGLDPLDFKADLAIWTGVLFLLIFLILWKTAWGPIASGLADREQGIADQITSAEQANEEARQLLAQYDEKLSKSEDEVHRMLDEARHDADRVGQGIVDKARQEAQDEHRRALDEIELATADALKSLAEQSATLAVDLAGKIVETRLDPSDHAKLIEEATARFAGNAGNGAKHG